MLEPSVLPQNEQPYSVNSLTHLVGASLAKQELQNIAVVGEITEWAKATSGHLYFTLKDKSSETLPSKKSTQSSKNAILKCTFFRSYNQSLLFEPKIGDEVQVVGSIKLYYQGGVYNFNARSLHKVGAGNLLLQIQELRRNLAKEGIINPHLRKNLPLLPQKIGIITGLKTAAIKDIFKQVADRYPHVNLLIAPALMQGELSADSIQNAFRELRQKKYGCDIILLSRGGGSTEDLMPFNDEKVARAIFQCDIPVLTGIGHEIDHPIADDVADQAGATPTDAAKIALPVVADLLLSLQGVEFRLNQKLKAVFDIFQEKLKRISHSRIFQEPLSIMENYQHRMDELEARLTHGFREKITLLSETLNSLALPYYLFSQILQKNQQHYTTLEEKLLAFSPIATLKRGYSITYQNEKIIRSVQKIDLQKKLELQLHDGKITVKPIVT